MRCLPTGFEPRAGIRRVACKAVVSDARALAVVAHLAGISAARQGAALELVVAARSLEWKVQPGHLLLALIGALLGTLQDARVLDVMTLAVAALHLG